MLKSSVYFSINKIDLLKLLNTYSKGQHFPKTWFKLHCWLEFIMITFYVAAYTKLYLTFVRFLHAHNFFFKHWSTQLTVHNLSKYTNQYFRFYLQLAVKEDNFKAVRKDNCKPRQHPTVAKLAQWQWRWWWLHWARFM